MRISKKDLRKAGEGIIKMMHEPNLMKEIPGNVPPPDPEMMKALDAMPKSKAKSKAKPETKIVHDCMQILQLHKIFCWRNNTGATWMGGRPIFYGLKGSADIIGMLPNGRFLAIEVKTETGKQSDSQKAFEKKVLENHGVYLLIHSAGELNGNITRI
jgi:hypothetical protein